MPKLFDALGNRPLLSNNPDGIWLFDELSLLQMRGAGHEAVVLHCECPGTKQMKQDQLA
jgi:hypothetical protein